MKVIAELSVLPVGVGVSLSSYIAACEEVLRKHGLTVQIHALGTNIEGELKAVSDAVQDCIEAVHRMGAPRVVTNVKYVTRTDQVDSMQEMIRSVEDKLK